MHTLKAINLLFILGFTVSLSGQSWEIFNTGLTAEKKEGEVNLSIYNRTDTLILKGDTVYFDGKTEMVFYESEGLLGVVDHKTLTILQKPLFRSLQVIGQEYCVVEVPEGFYFSLREFPLNPVSVIYEDIYYLIPLQMQNCMEEPAFIVRLKGKYGVVYSSTGYNVHLVEPSFDEILFSQCNEGNLIYFMRDGNKWGAGGCEGVEVKAAYERIEHIFGDCGNNGFFTYHKGKGGMIMSGQKDPLMPNDFEQVKYVKINDAGFVFGLNNNQIADFMVVNKYGDVTTDSKFEHVIKVRELEKSYMVYTADGEQMQMELTEQDLHKLEFTVENWIYLGY